MTATRLAYSRIARLREAASSADAFSSWATRRPPLLVFSSAWQLPVVIGEY